jgi:hypothetical protein
VTNQVANRGAGAIMQQSKLFDALPAEWDDLTANVSIGFPILGIKGGKWHYRFKGEDQILMDASGRFPTPAVQVVILKAQKELSRTYYQNGYVEGVNNPPDCWSSDGVRPDETVANPVNPVCATCPCDAWGSGATPAAPKAKACQQRRRTVVVPYSPDLTNEMGGGPILLSVPPGSLTNQVTYGNMLRDHSIHYAGVITELSFTQDANVAFPKIEFNYVGSLTDDEAQVIIGMREHEQVERILVSKMVPTEMEQPTGQEGAPQPAPQPAQQAAPRPATQAQGQRPMPRPSVVRAPAPTQAAPPPPPPPPPVQAAAPPPPPPVNRVGGFAMQRPQTAQAGLTLGVTPPPPPPPPPTGTIAGAIANKAPPPPTQRPVIKTMAPAVDGTVEEHADVAAGEPETTEAAIPQDMNQLFSSLMKAG